MGENADPRVITAGNEMARELARRMQSASLKEYPGRARSNVERVELGWNGRVHFVWISNNAHVLVEDNQTALVELVDHADHYFGTVGALDRQLRAADRLGDELARRMSASGISEVRATGTDFSRIVVTAEGHLGFTWRSNGHTTALHHNVPGSADFLRHHGRWQRQVSAAEVRTVAAERHTQAQLARARDAMKRHGGSQLSD